MISFLIMLIKVVMNSLLLLLLGKNLLYSMVIGNNWPVFLKRNKGGNVQNLDGSRLTSMDRCQ
ncbi:hypothetical protein Goshw_012191 [Gossypium schwendimanii]|uniref:Uncharacterized protein n=1 Tax=Gossypium schwendimanii TaxID=34291 RepID=A0A7J9L9U4_GOSSC|nr:hypothetical protein [Gossypium schwendimanii]